MTQAPSSLGHMRHKTLVPVSLIAANEKRQTKPMRKDLPALKCFGYSVKPKPPGRVFRREATRLK